MIALGKRPVSNVDQDTFMYTLWNMGESILLMYIDYKGTQYALLDQLDGPCFSIFKEKAPPKTILKLPAVLTDSDFDRRHGTESEIKLAQVAFGVVKSYRLQLTEMHPKK